MTGQGTATSAAAASASALAALAASSAYGADMPPQYKAPAYVAPNWQGFYIGVAGGGSWLNGTSDDKEFTPFGISGISGGYYSHTGETGRKSSFSKFGGLVGLEAGFNWQTQSGVVLGLEADGSWVTGTASATGYHGSTFTSPGNPFGDPPFPGYSPTLSGPIQKTSKVDALIMLRGRIGMDFNGTLPFLTAGFAMGHVKAGASFNYFGGDGPFPSDTSEGSKTQWMPGYVVGLGVEHKFTPNVSLKAEALWVGFADSHFDLGPSGYYGSIKVQNNLAIGRVGLNYHF